MESKQQLESQEVRLASSLREAEAKIAALVGELEHSRRENDRLAAERDTAVANRERDLQRIQEEKAYNQRQIDEARDREKQREDEVYDLRESERDLLDKLKRLEMSVANKSSDIESLEKMLAAERERREAENGEIRNMLLQE